MCPDRSQNYPSFHLPPLTAIPPHVRHLDTLNGLRLTTSIRPPRFSINFSAIPQLLFSHSDLYFSQSRHVGHHHFISSHLTFRLPIFPISPSYTVNLTNSCRALLSTPVHQKICCRGPSPHTPLPNLKSKSGKIGGNTLQPSEPNKATLMLNSPSLYPKSSAVVAPTPHTPLPKLKPNSGKIESKRTTQTNTPSVQ